MVTMLRASERYGSNEEEYLLVGEQDELKVTLKQEHQPEQQQQKQQPKKWTRFKHILKSAFLPQGYPQSVSEDYLEYQCWDTLQAFCSSITGLLATQAVLKGYGVGDETATVAGATITWMLKDGMGMVGRILFAWMKGTQLDCDAKRWRLFADILNDLAILLDLCAPLFNRFFVVIVCLSSVARSLVGVAGGATRAALTLHQARRDNMADVSAKDGSQETLVNLMALLAGFVITPLVADNQLLVWVLFFLFTFLHLFSNYRAVCCVVMETLNIPRLQISLENYIRTSVVMDPKEVARLDPVLSPPGHTYQVKPGVRLSTVVKSASDLQASSSSTYFIGLDHSKRRINISYQSNVLPRDIIKGCFHALLLDLVMKYHREKRPLTTNSNGVLFGRLLKTLQDCGDELNDKLLLEESGRLVEVLFPVFEEGLNDRGWDMKVCHLGVDEWRFWSDIKKDQ